MERDREDLRQLKGIGVKLAASLQAAGFDTFAKLARADQAALRQIKGLNARAISSIVEQAGALALVEPDRDSRIEALEQQLSEVREKLQVLAQDAGTRFAQDLIGTKLGNKLSAELRRVDELLNQLGFDGKKKARRAGKALDKVQKRIAEIPEDAGLKKVRKTLKRARKAVDRAIS